MKAIIFASITLAVALLTGQALPVYAECDQARAAVTAHCPCAGAENATPWNSRGHYLGCVKEASSAALRQGANQRCKAVVDGCASRSVCGRPGAVTCIADGKCVLVSEQRCTRRGGTVSTATSCCDVNL